jgi:Uma2 family endonuclease
MGLPVEKKSYTIQEYLLMEEKAADRHEFHDGEILMMCAGTFRRSQINVNFMGTIHPLLKCSPCHALGCDMRLRIADRPHYIYADISVVCGKPQFDPDDPKKTTIMNPRLVVEVLSESTESYDRGAKFDLYRQIPSLEEYVLVSQWQPMIETFFRQSTDTWLLSVFKGPTATIHSLQITLPLAEIYAGVEFEAPPPPPAAATGG